MEPFLLVDDRDGRVLAQFADAIEALRALDELDVDDPELARFLSLVRFDEGRGAVIGVEATTRLRSLT
jgi:hypothetical protein